LNFNRTGGSFRVQGYAVVAGLLSHVGRSSVRLALRIQIGSRLPTSARGDLIPEIFSRNGGKKRKRKETPVLFLDLPAVQ
jgi:hypothetical protein